MTKETPLAEQRKELEKGRMKKDLDEFTTPTIVKCECGYEGIRWNDNLICRKCEGLMKIISFGEEDLK